MAPGRSMTRVGGSAAYNELQRSTAKHARAELVRKLKDLRARIKASKTAQRTRGKEIRGLARATLNKIRERTRTLRAALRTASEAARYLARYAVHGGRVIVSREQAQALRALASEHEHITHEAAQAKEAARERASLRRAEGWREADARAARRKVTSGERRAESDDEIRGNIPRELLPAFEKYRRVPREAAQWKATPRATRTDAFLQWAHENSAQVERAYNEQEAQGYGEQSAEDYAAEQELAQQIARLDMRRRAGGTR